ncbi:hypothetical protein RRG08_038824 [Elysia crispata]|uniref:Uncharacterized protein n=1 Tax=Elysia crispata TaxID=231223 RepID=A0AAE1D3W6_9GAST|nr:hypothetical protein RRG08_038824 [Elysia crispata]
MESTCSWNANVYIPPSPAPNIVLVYFVDGYFRVAYYRGKLLQKFSCTIDAWNLNKKQKQNPQYFMVIVLTSPAQDDRPSCPQGEAGPNRVVSSSSSSQASINHRMFDHRSIIDISYYTWSLFEQNGLCPSPEIMTPAHPPLYLVLVRAEWAVSVPGNNHTRPPPSFESFPRFFVVFSIPCL